MREAVSKACKDPNRAIERIPRTSVEWANMAGNHLGAQRVKQMIADLQASQAEPAELGYFMFAR